MAHGAARLLLPSCDPSLGRVCLNTAAMRSSLMEARCYESSVRRSIRSRRWLRPISSRDWRTVRTRSRCRGHCAPTRPDRRPGCRSEEHTSELQSLMRISYAVFCLKKKKNEMTLQQFQVVYV